MLKLETQRGFSLIELSIVLIIMSVLIGAGVSIATIQLENSRVASTKTKQMAIKIALLNFMSRNYRLPCPAIATLVKGVANYGLEAINPGICAGVTGFGAGTTRNVRGIVPWKSLGLTDEAAVDGYGRRFTYQLLRTQTNLNQDLISGLQGNIDLFDASGGAQINPLFPAVVILLSHGNNGRGAYLPGSGRRMLVPTTADELENTDNDFNFVQKEYSTLTANPFDDIIMWLEPSELVTQLAKISSVQTPNTIVNSKFINISNTLLSFVAADNVDPDGGGPRNYNRRLPYADGRANPVGLSNGVVIGYIPWVDIGVTAADATDPWGNVIRYSVNPNFVIQGMLLSDPPNDLSYTLTSDGADGAQTTADDLTLVVRVAKLRGDLLSSNVPLDP